MPNFFCLFMTKSEDKEVTVKPVEKSVLRQPQWQDCTWMLRAKVIGMKPAPPQAHCVLFVVVSEKNLQYCFVVLVVVVMKS